MPVPAIYVVNHSTLVSDADAATMTEVVGSQLFFHTARLWGRQPNAVKFTKDEASAPAGSWIIGILDDPDQADALGWHTEDSQGRIFGRVFARPALSHGAKVLEGANAVSTTLSHEVLETFGDPNVNQWADAGNGISYSWELCDAVESDFYELRLQDGKAAAVSNFLLPAWFDPQAPRGSQFDYMKRVNAAFQMTQGGYVVIEQEGQQKQLFGEQFPNWKKELKLGELSRGGRRLR